MLIAGCMAMSFSVHQTYLTMSKLLSPNMYCWSYKTLVSICWTDLSVNGISVNSIWSQKQITECHSLQDTFDGNVAIYNVYNGRRSDVVSVYGRIYTNRSIQYLVGKKLSQDNSYQYKDLKNGYGNDLARDPHWSPELWRWFASWNSQLVFRIKFPTKRISITPIYGVNQNL